MGKNNGFARPARAFFTFVHFFAVVSKTTGSFSNDNGDGNENVTNLHIQWAKAIALHAPHVRFSYLSISLPSSAKQQREITKFEVLRRTSALGDKFSFFSPKFSAARNGFNSEGPPHLCHIKDGAYYCYCAYVLRISRYSDFLSVMLTNTGIFLRGLKLSGESRS